jgi:hypothetical protein
LPYFGKLNEHPKHSWPEFNEIEWEVHIKALYAKVSDDKEVVQFLNYTLQHIDEVIRDKELSAFRIKDIARGLNKSYDEVENIARRLRRAAHNYAREAQITLFRQQRCEGSRND